MAAARLKVLRPPRCVISLETAALELPAAGLPSRRAARSQVAPPESPARIRLSRRKRPLARSPSFAQANDSACKFPDTPLLRALLGIAPDKSACRKRSERMCFSHTHWCGNHTRIISGLQLRITTPFWHGFGGWRAIGDQPSMIPPLSSEDSQRHPAGSSRIVTRRG